MSLKCLIIPTILYFVISLLPMTALAESINCNNRSVSTGVSKGEVIDKCGQPLSKDMIGISSSGEVIRSGARSSYSGMVTYVDSWTYKIGGCYREFIFNGNRLERIIDGNKAD